MGNEMIERVAKAICDSLNGPNWPVSDDDHLAARAAIKAMREPTPEMVAAVEETQVGIYNERIFDYWEGMIDAALQGTTPA